MHLFLSRVYHHPHTLTKEPFKMSNKPSYNSDQRLLASIYLLAVPTFGAGDKTETRLAGKTPRPENGMIPVIPVIYHTS